MKKIFKKTLLSITIMPTLAWFLFSADGASNLTTIIVVISVIGIFIVALIIALIFVIKHFKKYIPTINVISQEITDKFNDDSRKQNQGKMQEEKVEEWLKTAFVDDEIESIKIGTKGADIFQKIYIKQQKYGSIYYEIKHTKDWSHEWIPKFKSDIIEKEADVGILVTNVFPKKTDKWYLDNNIFVCSFTELEFLSFAIRLMIIKINEINIANENKGDKQVSLYNYVTSNQFKIQFEMLVDYFTTQSIELDQEEKAMNKIWKKRKKQIEGFKHNMSLIIGNMEGVLGNEIPKIKTLELAHLSGDKNEKIN